MLRSAPLILSLGLVGALPSTAAAEILEPGSQPGVARDSVTRSPDGTGGQSYGDRNRGGPYGFYSYPRHRHIDGGGARQLPSSVAGGGTSLPGNTHGSAYYGLNYGAPYFGGGYYDGGVYFRERRD